MLFCSSGRAPLAQAGRNTKGTQATVTRKPLLFGGVGLQDAIVQFLKTGSEEVSGVPNYGVDCSGVHSVARS